VFAEAVSSDGWYKMGDYGYYDEKERVHVLERVKDLIRLPSGKLVSRSRVYIYLNVKFMNHSIFQSFTIHANEQKTYFNELE
jgi:long-subunit acyl-CoA synthetase (AMP-forming)